MHERIPSVVGVCKDGVPSSLICMRVVPLGCVCVWVFQVSAFCMCSGCLFLILGVGGVFLGAQVCFVYVFAPILAHT